MSFSQLDPPLVPKDGHTLRLLVPVRVSDPTKQDERSLGDQRNKADKWLQDRTDYPFELVVLEGRQSGELLDREEYLKLIDEVATRRYDAVISEDLGRIVRRIQAHLFCEHCVDHQTRVIAINDNVDTARDGWQDASIFSAWHHERSNRDTSQRIKRTQRSRFGQGGCLSCEIYGYVKPLGAKSEADVSKDPGAESVYREWFRLLDEEDASFADVARWLKATKVPLPPHARNQEWDGKMVARTTFNPMLKGMRERNRRKTQRVGSGKYKSIKAAPNELLQKLAPHLAFFEESYFDRVVAKLKDRNGAFRRTDNPAADPCLFRAKKDTRYPGRVTFCGICGRCFVWGGHGQADHLMCSGARSHRCWNGVTFDGTLAAPRIAAAILSEAELLQDFDPAFREMVNEEAGRLDDQRDHRIRDLKQKLEDVIRAISRVLAFISKTDVEATASVSEELQRLEREKMRFKAEITEAEKTPSHAIEIPTAEEIKHLARESISELVPHSPEFVRAMRKLAPKILVFPYRLCDGGGIVLRARFRLELGNLLPNRQAAAALREPLTRVLTVNLFDSPQREEMRSRIIALRAAGKSERQAAVECRITTTAAQRAASLQRMMDIMGITDPYVAILHPPEDCQKRRRHKSPDYRFDPLPGAGEL